MAICSVFDFGQALISPLLVVSLVQVTTKLLLAEYTIKPPKHKTPLPVVGMENDITLYYTHTCMWKEMSHRAIQ